MHVGDEFKSVFILNTKSSLSSKPHNIEERRNPVSEITQLCLTSIGLIISIPIFIIIAILIKLTSSGPIFYRGFRVGKGRRIFRIYKFRTLQIGAEEKIGARLLNEQDSFYTKIGKFLKRTKLDELPQLINVLRGEMNLVGPRPIRPIFLDNLSKEIPLYNLRFNVKPGMTGLAQIKGGYFTNPKDKLRYELIYIKNRSLILDLKLIFLTFFKILNRWFTLGFLSLILFLFISFIPKSIIPSIYINVFGSRLDLLTLTIIASTGWIIAKRIPKGRFHLYYTLLNLPILIFIGLSLMGSYFAIQPYAALHGCLYYTITGFMIVLLITNSDVTQRFILNATKTVAIITVLIALIGLLELFLIHHLLIWHVEFSITESNIKMPRISSTLGNPVVLSTYLVLGFPLLLCELSYAGRKHQRDFWLISTTVVFISIILTQTRIGLISLALTGSIFFYKSSKRKFIIFLAICGFFFFVLALTGGSRYSPSKVLLEWRDLLISSGTYLARVPLERLLIGIGTKNLKNPAPLEILLPTGLAEHEKLLPSNMHLILIIENGIIGWAVMMWILFAALKTLCSSYAGIKDQKLQMIAWAIFSSVSGFMISMNNLETFFNFSIQILFWGLVGVGISITLRFSSKKPRFMRLWKFGD